MNVSGSIANRSRRSFSVAYRCFQPINIISLAIFAVRLAMMSAQPTSPLPQTQRRRSWMKIQRYIIAFALGLGVCQFGIAQAPAGAPAGSTGQCKDGSYTNAPKKTGACHGHKGVQQWFTADASTPAAPAKPANTAPAATPASAPAPAPAAPPAAAPAATPAPAQTHAAKSSSSTANMAQAPGGGPGMVWLNTPTNVYHCPGSRYYGKTKDGKYMTEAQAKAAGAHPDHGKACGQ